jgi:hypothetical protein
VTLVDPGSILTVGTSSGGPQPVVSIDIANSAIKNGINVVHPGGALLVYGNGEGGQFKAGDVVATFTGLTKKNFANRSALSIWNLVGNNIEYGGTRSFVHESDAYLIAMAMHQRYTAWNAVRDRLISGNGRCCHLLGYYGQTPVCELCDLKGAFAECTCTNRNIWVNFVGRQNSFMSNYRDDDGDAINDEFWKIKMQGVQGGADCIRTRREQVGMFFGFEEGKITNADDRMDADDLYFGIYGACVLPTGADIRGVFAYGWQTYDMTRKDQFTYRALFKGHTTESTFEIGKRATSGAWSIRPAFAIDIMTNNIDSTREEAIFSENDLNLGMAEPVIYERTNLTQVYARVGSDVRCQMGSLILNGGAYYAYNVNPSALKTRVTNEFLIDENKWLPLVGSKMGRSLLAFDASGTLHIGKGFALIGGYQSEYVFDCGGKPMHNRFYLGSNWKF